MWTDALTHSLAVIPMFPLYEWTNEEKTTTESFAFIISFTWQFSWNGLLPLPSPSSLCKMFADGREVYWNFSFGPSFNFKSPIVNAAERMRFFSVGRRVFIMSEFFLIFSVGWGNSPAIGCNSSNTRAKKGTTARKQKLYDVINEQQASVVIESQKKPDVNCKMNCAFWHPLIHYYMVFKYIYGSYIHDSLTWDYTTKAEKT